jgi:hypothetical protein
MKGLIYVGNASRELSSSLKSWVESGKGNEQFGSLNPYLKKGNIFVRPMLYI